MGFLEVDSCTMLSIYTYDINLQLKNFINFWSFSYQDKGFLFTVTFHLIHSGSSIIVLLFTFMVPNLYVNPSMVDVGKKPSDSGYTWNLKGATDLPSISNISSPSLKSFSCMIAQESTSH